MHQSDVSRDRTVDPGEVDRYRALADMWWQPDGKLWPLHTLNRLRTRYIRDQLCDALARDAAERYPLSGLHILDIGCGGGLLSEAMAGFGATVTGVDVVDSNIQVARLHAEQQQGLSIDYRLSTAEALTETGEQFDVVLNMEVVEHVADLSVFQHAVNRLVRPGGFQFIATINRNPTSFVVAILGAEYIFRLLPKGTHQWRRFPKPEEVQDMLTKDGLEVIRQVGVKVNPLSRRMWLSRSMSVNYMLMARKDDADA